MELWIYCQEIRYKMSKMKINRKWDGKMNLSDEMGFPRWELINNEMEG
jgi:hypothetical protein